MNQIKKTEDQSSLILKLLEIFKILSGDKNLKFYDNNKIKIVADNKTLIQVDPQKITIPILLDNLFLNESPLADNFIEMNPLNNFFRNMSEENSVVGLNHIGFCYKVDSQDEERKRIKNQIVKTNWRLYEMESNDAGLWLFVGNNKNWQDPMVELLPVEKTEDKWVNYWLPHIQIDVDTNLSYQGLGKNINKFLKGEIIPFRSCVINNIVYGVRARLGIISGVNINIDFATRERDRKYSRERLLKIIV